MPITSSSAPLRDLVNQYGGNSPQVTRIVAAVNASSFLEGLWNDFAARATSGGGSPVIRVAADWRSGDQVWIIDLVTPFGGAAEVIKELRETVFAGREVHQLMPDAHGQGKTLTWPAVGALH